MSTVRISTRSPWQEWAASLDLLAAGHVDSIRTSGALSARRGLGTRGDASPLLFDLLEAFERRGELTATVYSYRTPIAAHIAGTWYRLPGRYSVTTSRHQNRISVGMVHLDTLEQFADVAELLGLDLQEVSR